MRRFPGLGDRKDFLGGLLILVLGLATGVQASSYDIGSLRRMGPGFFPLGLGVILGVTGVLLMLTAKSPTPPAERLAPEWRGWLCICAGIAAFVVLGQWGGLIPATFAVVFIAARRPAEHGEGFGGAGRGDDGGLRPGVLVAAAGAIPTVTLGLNR